jgi:hypothetical protein
MILLSEYIELNEGVRQAIGRTLSKFGNKMQKSKPSRSQLRKKAIYYRNQYHNTHKQATNLINKKNKTIQAQNKKLKKGKVKSAIGALTGIGVGAAGMKIYGNNDTY